MAGNGGSRYDGMQDGRVRYWKNDMGRKELKRNGEPKTFSQVAQGG